MTNRLGTPGPQPAPPSIPKAAELRGLLAKLISATSLGSEERWAELIGAVEVLPFVLYPESNWRIDPDGSWGEVEIIWKATDNLRKEHPIVRP